MNTMLVLLSRISLILLCVKLCQSDSSLFYNHLDVLKENSNLSSQCLEQTENLDHRTLLAMFDASTKIPSGILYGSFFDLGNFDECLNINSPSPAGPIRGKYCLGTIPLGVLQRKFDLEEYQLNRKVQKIPLHPEPRVLGNTPNSIGFHFSICVPHGCSAAEISALSQYTEEYCYSEADETEYSAGFYITVVIIGIFLAFVLISTTYDALLQQQGRKPSHEILIAYSALSNGRKLISSTKNPDQLLCLNGIKAISMMWVVLGHCYSSATTFSFANGKYLMEFQKAVENMFLMSATVSVDTFFVVGGLVTVYTFLKAYDKGVKFNVLLYYLHRYIRLTPALAIIVLLQLYVITYVGNGPLWTSIDQGLAHTCRKGWWSTLLYVENYHQVYCVPQSWYLSVDMQLFILSPLVLLPLAKWPKYTKYALGALTVAGIIVPFTVGYVNNLTSLFGPDPNTFMTLYYTQTYARFGPYVIGMLVGSYLFDFKRSGKNPLSPISVCLLWMVALGGLLACVYAPYENDNSRISNAFMLGFQRPLWAVALSILIYLCVTGYGGLIDWFLSLPVFQFLTKLSYCIYLVHYQLINMKLASARTIFTFSNLEMMMQFWGYFMFSLALSVVLCLTFESPFIIIERVLFGQGKRKEPVKKPQV